MGPLRVMAVALLLAGASSSAASQEPPPVAPPAPKARTLDGDLQAVRALMRADRYVDAHRALRKVFEDYRDSPEVVRRIADIEEDLKLCTYRAQETPPSAKDLFGQAAKTFDVTSRKLVLEYPEGPGGLGWEDAPGGLKILPLRFDEVTLEFETEFSGGLSFVLCWDPDVKSGYVVIPGFYGARQYQNAVIVRFDDGKETELARRSDPSFGDGMKKGKLVRSQGGGITLTVAGAQRVTAQDSKGKRGYLGIAAGSMKGLVIRGTSEALQYKSLLAAWYDRGYRDWAERKWDRAKELPAWTLGKAPSAAHRPRLPLPSDGPAPVPDDLASALESWRKEDVPGFLLGLPQLEGLPPLTRLLVEGLTSFASGRTLEADARFTGILDRQSDYGPALLYRGLGRLRRRDLDGARADLEKARGLAPALPELWLGLANLAIVEGNLEGAHQALTEARTRGAADEETERFTAFVRRSLRGPAWTKRWEARGRYATVSTDHSQDLADQVLKSVDATLGSCVALFPRGKKPPVPFRVFVFASREGFLGYAEELGRDMDSLAGAYVAKLHEMVLFVPDVSRTALWDTVRHESFHAFIHGFVEDVPTWFDEGWAQCVARGKVDLSTIRMAALEPEELAALGHKVNVEGFMAMSHAQFMKNARVHYPLAQALVTFLYSHEKGRYRERLAGYFEALRTGLSRKEAYEKQFRPVIDEVTGQFNIWLAEGGKVGGR